MKHLILIICLLCWTHSANAFWPFTKGPDPLVQANEKITALEHIIAAQALTLNRWQIAAGSLAVGCLLALIIGAALGSITRKHHHESSRRLGRTSPPTRLNGRKPNVIGEADEENVHSTLAA
ncbi:hypothetical protein [Brevifollis gellanilyticus]|uniref:Uncharacterized protein n=1 Tax=Brevifollis gellanilyticus TaxID=748831 RepID=A0A512M8S7_9BACT|nr:hypothetical protein [Brevifollis gellanilyticus]GEP43103.1 hypothetical protein BGE01nite_23940 [Brevifollis gellanilyticus]